MAKAVEGGSGGEGNQSSKKLGVGRRLLSQKLFLNGV